MKKHVASDHGEHKNSGKAGYCSACNKTVSQVHTQKEFIYKSSNTYVLFVRRDFTVKET